MLGRLHLVCRKNLATRSVAKTFRRKTKRGTSDKTSRENILQREIHDALALRGLTVDDARIPEDLRFKFAFAKTTGDFPVQNVQIVSATSEGEGLGIIHRSLYDSHCTDEKACTVVVVPKTVPGDVVDIVLRRHTDYAAEAELLRVVGKVGKRGKRDDRLVVCPHFSTCSGCQFQMMSYENQLEFKKDAIRKAYRYFYPTALEEVSDVGEVVPSPLQYSYRTKLTPHSHVPKNITLEMLPLPLGFNDVRPRTRHIVDVDRCPLATPSVNNGLDHVRHRFHHQLNARAAGSSADPVPGQFLLRDSFRVDRVTGSFDNVCVDSPRKVVTEKVGDHVFQFAANEFFQGNRSVLPTFLDFIRFHLSHIDYTSIVDAYCGSGFLGIGLSGTIPENGKLLGIEISGLSIKYAEHNAKLNGLHNAVYVESNSDKLFETDAFLRSGVRGHSSVVLMNPSRKGSSRHFMKQLLKYRPKAVVYVSCNPFTQARDLADFAELQAALDTRYEINCITGFDFYPQTKHVESVAVLQLHE